MVRPFTLGVCQMNNIGTPQDWVYTHLNHNDEKRRASYLARAKGIKDKNGNLTWKNKSSANYFSIRYLWAG